MKYKLIIAVLYMIMSACNNTDSNEFAFSNYSWECPKEGGRKIFTSNKDEWKIDQLILDGIIIKEYSPEYIKDKNQSFTPCQLYTSPSPRDRQKTRMPSSA